MDFDFPPVSPSQSPANSHAFPPLPQLQAREDQSQPLLAGELSASNATTQIAQADLAKLLAQELQLTDTLRQLRSEIERDKHELAVARNKVEAHRIDRSNLSAAVESMQREKGQLLVQLKPLREELDERLWVRETLISEMTTLHGQVEKLEKQKDGLVHELTALSTQHQSLQIELEKLYSQRSSLTADLINLENNLEGLTKVEPTQTTDPALPLLFSDEAQPVSKQWDPYPLESEFYTDEIKDARKVADLVAKLPGLNGSLLVKNKGSVLASNLAEHLHHHLEVPKRNYDELFDHLPNPVRKYQLDEVRLETFSLEKESLTVAKSGDAFLVVSHPQTKLRPGVPEKLATVTVELAKMYETKS